MLGLSRLTALTLLTTTLALPQITRKGKYLYDPSGTRFYIKGLAYQPQGELSASSAANAENGNFPEPSSYIDPLSSAANCTRDLPYLQQLGVNALRVYSVDSKLDHDACMKTFDDAGIYVLLDVSLPLNGSIDRASPTWSTNLLDAYVSTIDKFLPYDNVLAFNIGNEVINLPTNTDAARKPIPSKEESPLFSLISRSRSVRQGCSAGHQSLPPKQRLPSTRRLQQRRRRPRLSRSARELPDMRERYHLLGSLRPKYASFCLPQTQMC